jgi:hypothetical protein|tara:strand:+ start:95 stop:475 length:381 start_codon:yes stop_codon:yes gene_type:complete
MSYSRMIRQRFFINPDVNDLNPEERYFLLGLVCLANDQGKFWMNHANLRSQIFPTDDIDLELVKVALKKLEEREIICVYKEEKHTYGHFPLWRDKSWVLFQRLDHPRDDDIPECPKHSRVSRIGSK